MTKGKRKCRKNEDEICDFCIHFNMFKTIDGGNVDGDGNCGLHKKTVHCGDGCKDYYCQVQYARDQRRKS